jgi:S-adenosylmethionine-diacylglycerol 3-amino-3-carboxypropyl transferase
MKLLERFWQRAFGRIHGSQLIYNSCWEDPRLDREALRLGPGARVVMITSAGCNALDYALEGPERIDCVDLNPRQNALLELKIAGIRALDFETFFTIFGEGHHKGFKDVYRRRLRPLLSHRARAYWDRWHWFFLPVSRRGSFYFHGSSGTVAWLLNQYLDRVAGVRRELDRLLQTTSVRQQQEIYHGQVRQAVFGKTLRWFCRRSGTLSMLGVPQPQVEQLNRDHPGGVARFIEDCISAVFSLLPLADNYFWRVYLTGRYSRDCCPEYLRPPNFKRLADGLVDRIHVHDGSIESLLAARRGDVTHMVLLDHMDWMSMPSARDALRNEWRAILHAAAPGARLIWRSAATSSQFIDELDVPFGSRSWRLRDLLSYDRPLAARLHALDRVHTYGSFHIASLPTV